MAAAESTRRLAADLKAQAKELHARVDQEPAIRALAVEELRQRIEAVDARLVDAVKTAATQTVPLPSSRLLLTAADRRSRGDFDGLRTDHPGGIDLMCGWDGMCRRRWIRSCTSARPP